MLSFNIVYGLDVTPSSVNSLPSVEDRIKKQVGMNEKVTE